MPKVSVIICTYNRCESLKDTLTALREQNLSSDLSLEIVVVDNNSKDRTKNVVELASQNSPWPIKYFFEPNQGKSYALNRGILEAKGDLLAFTDDDAVPEVHWVENICKAFSNFGADCVGGKILPLWSRRPPFWLVSDPLRKHFGGILALLDHGDEVLEGKMHEDSFLYGANIAIRKSVFSEIGLFRTDLGPSGSNPFRGEDTEMLIRILAAGKKVVYAPDIVVYHKIGSERMKMAYVRRRRFYGSRSDFQRLPSDKQRIARWFLRECVENGLKALFSYLVGKKESAIRYELLFWAQCGHIVESLRRSKRCVDL